MARFLIFILALLMFLPLPVMAQDEIKALTIDLAEDRVDITTGFNGAHLTLFGTKEEEGDIAIIVKGPERHMVVRKKEPFIGVWMNRKSLAFKSVPIYYDLALSQAEALLAAPKLLQKHGIGLDALVFEPQDKEDRSTVARFREALIRNKQIQGHFPLEPRKITFLNDNFFRADFLLQPDLPTGDYMVETYLFRDGAVKSVNKTELRVAQVGFNAQLRKYAYQQRFVYGVAGVLLAAFAGWIGYASMRKN